jgi:hypothetical protein
VDPLTDPAVAASLADIGCITVHMQQLADQRSALADRMETGAPGRLDSQRRYMAIGDQRAALAAQQRRLIADLRTVELATTAAVERSASITPGYRP